MNKVYVSFTPQNLLVGINISLLKVMTANLTLTKRIPPEFYSFQSNVRQFFSFILEKLLVILKNYQIDDICDL